MYFIQIGLILKILINFYSAIHYQTMIKIVWLLTVIDRDMTSSTNDNFEYKIFLYNHDYNFITGPFMIIFSFVIGFITNINIYKFRMSMILRKMPGATNLVVRQ